MTAVSSLRQNSEADQTPTFPTPFIGEKMGKPCGEANLFSRPFPNRVPAIPS